MLSPLKLRSLETKADLFGSSPLFAEGARLCLCGPLFPGAVRKLLNTLPWQAGCLGRAFAFTAEVAAVA